MTEKKHIRNLQICTRRRRYLPARNKYLLFLTEEQLKFPQVVLSQDRFMHVNKGPIHLVTQSLSSGVVV
jgi:hypothetical protein